MESALTFLHIALCATAICAGSVVFSDLIRRRFVKIRLCWFVRYSLGSNIAALLLACIRSVPTVAIAMVAVYATGVIVLAWRKFKLGGAWRNVFAFTLTFVLYLNVLDFILQMFGPTALIIQFGRSLLLASQIALVAFFIGLGTLSAQRLASMFAWRSAWRPSLTELDSRQHAHKIGAKHLFGREQPFMRERTFNVSQTVAKLRAKEFVAPERQHK